MAPFDIIVIIWIGTGLLTFVLLLGFGIRAPYGRHSRKGWGKMIDNRSGWFWMELPALLVMPTLAMAGPSPKNGLLIILTGLWLLHYGYRTLIFPFKLKTKGKKMPVSIVASAFIFNTINGSLNGYFLGWLSTGERSMYSLHVGIGIVLFFTGMYVNRRADRRLINLRNNGSGYRIPRGWLFEKVSCPNHLGEIIEWAGFAIVAWNLPALSFALWTFFNLAPRAQNHHVWYREYFPDYPENRKALIPCVW